MPKDSLTTPSQFHLVNQFLFKDEDILSPFAITDLFIQEAAKGETGFLHFWETYPTVILGMKDTRMPKLNNGLAYLQEVGYTTIARNSGGLAVISEPGILNFSIIIPNPSESPISVNQGYELMTQLITMAFADLTDEIEAKEIVDSYCPGDFDLSIGDKKFAGISQRRIGAGLAVMIYLSVSENQAQRGQVVRAFYQKSLEEAFGTQGYPAVNPDSMANISTLLAQPFTIADVKKRLIMAGKTLFTSSITPLELPSYLQEPTIQERYQKHLNKMASRNQEILPTGGSENDSV